MDCVKREILHRHLEALKKIGSKSLFEQCQKLAKNGNCWFEDKRQWTKIGSPNTKQITGILEREPRGFEALICALLHGSKECQAVAYKILEDEALSEEGKLSYDPFVSRVGDPESIDLVRPSILRRPETERCSF